MLQKTERSYLNTARSSQNPAILFFNPADSRMFLMVSPPATPGSSRISPSTGASTIAGCTRAVCGEIHTYVSSKTGQNSARRPTDRSIGGCAQWAAASRGIPAGRRCTPVDYERIRRPARDYSGVCRVRAGVPLLRAERRGAPLPVKKGANDGATGRISTGPEAPW